MMNQCPFSVKVEAWDKNGYNLGTIVVSFKETTMELAICHARRMYRKYWQGKEREITIFYKLERVWCFYKNKIRTWEAPEIIKKQVSNGV